MDPVTAAAADDDVCSSSSVDVFVADAANAKARPRDTSHYASTLAAGVGSGALASIICAPLDLMKTRMQVWGDLHGPLTTTTTTATATSSGSSSRKAAGPVAAPPSPASAFRELIRREGWMGMFRGLGVTLVTVPLFWGVYFPLYDEAKHRLAAAHGSRYPDGLVHMSAAVFTGAVADVICNPLFVIRTRLQTQALHQIVEGPASPNKPPPGIVQTARALHERHGMAIFWRGMSANLIGLSHVAVQFPAYEALKKAFRDRRGNNTPETPAELLVASGTAKMGASLLSYPHEVLRSRMMDSRSRTPPTLIGTARHILTQEGVAGLYTGLSVTLVRVVPNCCVTFLSYEMILRYCRDHLTTASGNF